MKFKPGDKIKFSKEHPAHEYHPGQIGVVVVASTATITWRVTSDTFLVAKGYIFYEESNDLFEKYTQDYFQKPELEIYSDFGYKRKLP